MIGPHDFLTVPSFPVSQHLPALEQSHYRSNMNSPTASVNSGPTGSPSGPEVDNSNIAKGGDPGSRTFIGARGKPIPTARERKRKSRQNPELYGMFTDCNNHADPTAKEVERIKERQKAKRAVARAKREEEKAEKKRLEQEEKDKAKEERARLARERREAKEAAKQKKKGPERRREWLEARGLA